MSKNLTIAGASYSDVGAVDFPVTGGGTARYVDGSTVYTITVTDNGDGTQSWAIADGIPEVRLLNLNRTYEAGTSGVALGTVLDETKAYINVPYGTMNFGSTSCSYSNVSKNSMTMTEPGMGGYTIAVPVHLPDLGSKTYTLSFDYSGAGKVRFYYRYYNDAGSFSGVNTAHNDTAGGSGTTTLTISNSDGYTWVVFMFSSNTGKTKAYSNVSLVEN